MALPYLTLKNEMEWALQSIPRDIEAGKCPHCGQPTFGKSVDPKSGLGLQVPEEVRVGESACEALLANVQAYIKAVTKFAYSLMKDMSHRTTLKADEINIAVGAVTRAHIEQELQRKR